MSGFAAGFVLGLITVAAVVGGRGEWVMAWGNWLVLGLSLVILVDLQRGRLQSPDRDAHTTDIHR